MKVLLIISIFFLILNLIKKNKIDKFTVQNVELPNDINNLLNLTSNITYRTENKSRTENKRYFNLNNLYVKNIDNSKGFTNETNIKYKTSNISGLQ